MADASQHRQTRHHLLARARMPGRAMPCAGRDRSGRRAKRHAGDRTHPRAAGVSCLGAYPVAGAWRPVRALHHASRLFPALRGAGRLRCIARRGSPVRATLDDCRHFRRLHRKPASALPGFQWKDCEALASFNRRDEMRVRLCDRVARAPPDRHQARPRCDQPQSSDSRHDRTLFRRSGRDAGRTHA